MDTLFSIFQKRKGLLSNILKGLTLLSILFLSTGAVLEINQTTALAAPTIWRDDFNGPLQEGWEWVNENPDKWEFYEGFLRISAATEGTGTENLLLRAVSEGDFVIETRLIFEPDTNFQIAGLVIYQDEDHFLQFGRAFCDLEGPCIGNGIYFDQADKDNPVYANFATPVDNSSEAYLRLERQGNMVKGFFSYEGSTWFEIGTHWIPDNFQVLGVGLTASQDLNTPDWDIPADFDYFELTEGGGFLPEGYHDYDEGDVPSWACNGNVSVGGWAADPDNREYDLAIKVSINGEPLAEPLSASQYRQDLDDAGVCIDGNCSFHSPLELPPFIGSNSIIVYAQDIPTGEWVQLSSSPKTITCLTTDIYTYNPETGGTQAVTNTPDKYEFNPRWSPDGKKIVHDSWDFNFASHGIYITNVQTMKSKPLAGGEGGSYPTWSPNGRWIAFDRGADGDFRLFMVPSAGGTPKPVRDDAFMASWGPNSQRLVFNQPSDGSIRTVDINGGNETLVVEQGNGPTWSPNGQWIAYETDGNIWKVRVNIKGIPLGEPIQLTHEISWEGRPSWSQNSHTIAYHSGISGNTDIWTIPASGGMASWLTGAPYLDDYDPNYSNNGEFVAYSGLSPEGQAPRLWAAAYSYDPPPETFDIGPHPYHFEFEWNEPEYGTWDGQGGDFEVSPDAPDYPGYVLLRGPVELRGFGTPEGFMCEEIGEFKPDQMTRFLVGYLPEYGEITYPEAQAHFESIHAQVVWNGNSAELAQHEIIPFNWDPWFQYVCGFTEAPPKMDLRVNYGHDWIESFYEAGHEVLITVTEGDGETIKATATALTEPKWYWGDETGFQTSDSIWMDAEDNPMESPPDIQPYDWVFAIVDNGVTAQVQIGEISGFIDLENDAIEGTINAPWYDSEVNVECFPWGAPEPQPEMKFATILPNGNDSYHCSWPGEWDIQPDQDIGVGYFGADGHWVANAFYEKNPHFTIFPAWEWFDGYDWPDGATVNITVSDKPECTFSKESWGGFFNGGFPKDCNVQVNDTVTFDDGTTFRWHTVRELAITEIDLNADTISGTADAGATIYVWPHDGWFEPLQADSDGSGSWQVDLGGMGYEIQEGSAGRAEIRDEFGNATAVDWDFNPRIIVHTTDNWFRAEGFLPNTTLNFMIYETAGETLLYQSTTEKTASSGSVIQWVGDQMTITPGNQVIVSDGSSMRDIVLEDLKFDQFDTTQGNLNGTAPEPYGRTVTFGIGCWQRDDLVGDVTTDENGSWSVILGAPVPNDYGCVFSWIFDDDGDASEARPAEIILWDE
jgi:Tol biopolymer transport system component/regulation of enolase protein 1 (concanavalin A-like superfamily)